MVDSVNSKWYQTQIIEDKSNISKISLVKRELMGNINKIEINKKRKKWISIRPTWRFDMIYFAYQSLRKTEILIFDRSVSEGEGNVFKKYNWYFKNTSFESDWVNLDVVFLVLKVLEEMAVWWPIQTIKFPTAEFVVLSRRLFIRLPTGQINHFLFVSRLGVMWR